jgi:hypothetical protein
LWASADGRCRVGTCPFGKTYAESTVVGSIDFRPPLWATSIFRGFARSASGMVTVSTPFS